MPGSDTPDVLALRHAPQLRYHELEPYRADSPATMTDSFVAWNYSNGLMSREPPLALAMARPTGVTRALTLGLLVPRGDPYWEGGPTAQASDYLYVHDANRQGDSQEMRKRPGYADLVYCWCLPREDRVRFLQYWMFFYDNTYMGPLGHHEGDWEMVQVNLDEAGHPEAAVYHQHDGAVRRDWEEVERVDDGRRPVVYVAKGSHASYFDAKTHRRVFHVLRDHTSNGGDHIDPRVQVIDPAADRWVTWPGHWGDSPDSPQGPGLHDAWSDPDTVKSPLGGAESAEAPELMPGAVPLAPDVRPALDGDEVAVDFVLPPGPEPGRSDPVRLELALQGASGPPATEVYEVTGLEASVRLPLPPSGPPYRLLIGVYDVDDHELLLDPIEIAGGGAESPAAPSSAAHRKIARPRRARAARAEQTRVAVRAPDSGASARSELERRAGAAAAGSWDVRPLFPGTDADELRPWHIVTLDTPVLAGLDAAAAAIEAGRSLELDDGWIVEPQLPSSYEIDPEESGGAEAVEGEEPLEWAIEALHCRDAWELPGVAARGAGIVIGQPDTGYTDHPELEEGVLDRLRDFDVLTGQDDAHAVLRGFPPFAFPSHGTGTASVAVSRESLQIKGAAPAAQIVPIRAAKSVIQLFNADLAVAVERLRRLKVAVITISMGGVGYPEALHAAIRAAVADDVIVMAAAGQPLPIVVEPASFPECLGVGGTTYGDGWWNLSARGGEVDVAAPAKRVWIATTSRPLFSDRDKYSVARHSGTSFSVALTAGVAALWLAHHGRDALLERYPGRLQSVFRKLVRDSSREGTDWHAPEYGKGIVDALELLRTPLPDLDDVPPLDGGVAETVPPDAATWAIEQAGRLSGDPELGAQRALAVFGGDRAALARHGRELVYRLVEEPRVRAEVLPPTAGAETAAPAPRFPALAAAASPSLRADVT